MFLGIGLKILNMFLLSRTSLYVTGVHALANELFNYISVVVTSFCMTVITLLDID